MQTARLAATSRAIELISRNYARRVWWADTVDLMQEAWVEVLQSDLDGFPDDAIYNVVCRIAARRLQRYLWEMSSPVTGGSKPEQTNKDLFRADITEWRQPAHTHTPELLMLDAEARIKIPKLQEALRERMTELWTSEGYPPDTRLQASLWVLLEGIKPSVAAKRANLSVDLVYAETRWLKDRSCNDRKVRTILKSLNHRRSDLHAQD